MGYYILGIVLGFLLGLSVLVGLMAEEYLVGASTETTQELCEQDLERSNKCVQVWVDEDALNKLEES